MNNQATGARITFAKHREDNKTLFPTPLPDSNVNISPPGFGWLPAAGASGYRIKVESTDGTTVYEATTGDTPLHLPDRAFGPGAYVWDVAALDSSGAECDQRGRWRFTIPEGVPELPWEAPAKLLERVPGEHPRLLYPKADLPAIRASLNTTRKRSWQRCLKAAEEALDTPAPTYPSFHKIGDATKTRMAYFEYFPDFRRLMDRGFMSLSLAYLISGEMRFAEAAKRILMEVVSWPTDDDDVTSVSAKWGDEVGLSLARCLHYGYDWLYDALDDGERERVRSTCDARSWQVLRRLQRGDYLSAPGESHSGRLIAYLTEHALALAGEAEGAAVWLEYSLKGLTTFYPHWGDSEGGWAEGPYYGLAYNGFSLPAFESLRRLTGFDLWKRPFYNNVRNFFVYCVAPHGEMQPFGDGATSGGPRTRGDDYGELIWHHAHRFNDPVAGWWVNQLQGWTGSRASTALLFDDDAPSAKPTDLPNSRMFRGVGWAALHSALAEPEKDTFLLFKSSPFGSVSHSHADQNGFAIMQGGRALAIPSGHFGPNYGMPHHAEWTRATKANNCILVDGHGQVIRSASASGRLTEFSDDRGWSYVCGDATDAYHGRLRRWKRHILFLRPGLFLMLDDLAAPEPARFDWLLHAFDAMEIDANRVVSRRDGATLDVRLHTPGGLAISQTDKFETPYNEGVPEEFVKERPNHWHVTARTNKPARETRIGAVMAAFDDATEIELEELRHEGWVGARARGSFGSVEGWIQLRPGTSGPGRYDREVDAGAALFCGRDASGAVTVF